MIKHQNNGSILHYATYTGAELFHKFSADEFSVMLIANSC